MYLLMTDRYEFEFDIRVICLCIFVALTKKLIGATKIKYACMINRCLSGQYIVKCMCVNIKHDKTL